MIGWAQMSDLDFGLIQQNISNKNASFHYQGCPLSLKSGKLWLNSYVYWISITSNWFYSQEKLKQTNEKIIGNYDSADCVNRALKLERIFQFLLP